MKRIILTCLTLSPFSTFAKTISVSGPSQLSAALKSAKGGDIIRLSNSGNYSVSINASKNAEKYALFSSEVIIESASSSKAVFSNVSLTKVKNLTFRNIRFVSPDSNKILITLQTVTNIKLQSCDVIGKPVSGYGAGTGIKGGGSTNIEISNTLVESFKTGLQIFTTNGLYINNNRFDKIAYDVMQLNLDQNVEVTNNYMRKVSHPDGDAHQDLIQFTNDGSGTSATNVLISNNTLEAADPMTHGIYFGNANARKNPTKANFYKNVRILNNKVYTSQALAIAIGHTEGLVIEGNDVQQHPDVTRTTTVSFPVIRVETKSTGVTLRSNTTTLLPSAANSDKNWTPQTNPSSWVVSGNRIVPRR